MGVQYDQSYYKGLERVYGTDLVDGEQIQDLAKVATPMRRLLAFPNVFQHRVAPFELLDETKPGHRKLVVLWLVNPDRRIISTANVPPQQKDNVCSTFASLAEPKVCQRRLARSSLIRIRHIYLPKMKLASSASASWKSVVYQEPHMPQLLARTTFASIKL
jgi:Protein of unknown function (DUF4246)